MTNIHDLTNLLGDVRSEYQTAWQKAEEERKQELATLQRDYVRNTPTYAAKEKEIQLNYEVSIVAAREKAAKKTAEEIEKLKAWEQARVSRIDETALSKINALRGIPLTMAELQEVLAKNGRSNYWVQKAVGALAEENGIPVTELPLDASLDTKLNVLNQLSDQLDKLLSFYNTGAHDSESMRARFLYLNDDILNNAVNIYNNGVRDLSEADAAERYVKAIKFMDKLKTTQDVEEIESTLKDYVERVKMGS